MRVLERYFVDMYDYDERTSHYEALIHNGPWIQRANTTDLWSDFEGQVYLLGVF